MPVVGRLPHLTAAVAVQGMWVQGSPDSWAGVQAGVQAGEGKAGEGKAGEGKTGEGKAGEGKGPEGEGKGLEGGGRRETAEKKKQSDKEEW